MYSILRLLPFPRPPESRIAFRRSCFVHFIKKQGKRFVGKREKHGGEQILLARAGENSIIIYSKIIYYFTMDNMKMEE